MDKIGSDWVLKNGPTVRQGDQNSSRNTRSISDTNVSRFFERQFANNWRSSVGVFQQLFQTLRSYRQRLLNNFTLPVNSIIRKFYHRWVTGDRIPLTWVISHVTPLQEYDQLSIICARILILNYARRLDINTPFFCILLVHFVANVSQKMRSLNKYINSLVAAVVGVIIATLLLSSPKYYRICPQ